MFVRHDSAHKAHGGVGHREFGALFARVGHVSAAPCLLLDLRLVEAEAFRLFLFELRERLAAEVDGAPCGEHAVAMLAEHIGADRVLVVAGRARKRVFEAAGVERGAGADDAARVHAGEFPDFGGDDVARVRDGDPDAVEPRVGDRFDECLRCLGGVEQFAVAVLARESDLAGGVDDDVAFGEPRIVLAAVDERHVVRAEGERIAQILHFGGELGAVVLVSRALLRHIQFVANALQHEAVRHMRSHMPHADDADFRDSAHVVPPWWFGWMPQIDGCAHCRDRSVAPMRVAGAALRSVNKKVTWWAVAGSVYTVSLACFRPRIESAPA